MKEGIITRVEAYEGLDYLESTKGWWCELKIQAKVINFLFAYNTNMTNLNVFCFDFVKIILTKQRHEFLFLT